MNNINSMANFVIIIKNAILMNKKHVQIVYSKLKLSIIKILFSEGYIDNYKLISNKKKKKYY